VTGGSWELTALLESEKYQPQAINDGDAFPGVYSIKTSLNPLTPGLRDKGMIGYWSFDEGAGTTAYDRSGYGNNGTLYNSPTWTTGQVGGALSFDGVDDYVDCGINPVFNLTQLTMMLWIKTPNSMGQVWRNILSKTGSDRDFGFWMYSADNVKVYGLHQSSSRFGSWIAYLSIPFDLNTWHYVVITIDSTGLQKAYADGQFISSYQGVASNANNSYPIWIGRSDNYWSGLIDDVRIYNRALSDAEIQAIYNATK
jgi:hypothetical protein